MGTSQEPLNGDTPGKASEWLVALNEGPDDAALRARFDTWLAESPAHAADWAEITHALGVLRRTEPMHRQEWGAFAEERRAAGPFRDMPLDAGWAAATAATRYQPQPRRERRRIGHKRLALGLATAAACAACIAVFAGPDVALWLQADHLTRTAERQTVRLADGSTVQLAPQSAIDVVYGATGRHIRLLKGEAFFEVVHDAHRPFTVAAGGIDTTDLGTEFDIRMGADETDIAVRQGLVRIDAPEVRPVISEQLGAGQSLRIRRGQAERDELAPEEAGAWTRGQLVIKKRPVAEVVDELRPYYKGVILLRGATLARQSLTGVYNLSDPVEALRAVARAQGASVFHISPWVLVVSGS